MSTPREIVMILTYADLRPRGTACYEGNSHLRKEKTNFSIGFLDGKCNASHCADVNSHREKPGNSRRRAALPQNAGDARVHHLGAWEACAGSRAISHGGAKGSPFSPGYIACVMAYWACVSGSRGIEPFAPVVANMPEIIV